MNSAILGCVNWLVAMAETLEYHCFERYRPALLAELNIHELARRKNSKSKNGIDQVSRF